MNQARKMEYKFILTMKDVVIKQAGEKKKVDFLRIKWSEILTLKEVQLRTNQWETEKGFLTARMSGLDRVGRSLLAVGENIKRK